MLSITKSLKIVINMYVMVQVAYYICEIKPIIKINAINYEKFKKKYLEIIKIKYSCIIYRENI